MSTADHALIKPSVRAFIVQVPPQETMSNDLRAILGRLGELDEPRELAVPQHRHQGPVQRRRLATQLALTAVGLLAISGAVASASGGYDQLSQTAKAFVFSSLCTFLPFAAWLWLTGGR